MRTRRGRWPPVSPITALAALAIFAAGVAWRRRPARPHSVDTALPPDQLRDAFVTSMTGAGWVIVDDGNPMVAENVANLLGERWTVSLEVRRVDRRTRAFLEAVRHAGQVDTGGLRPPWVDVRIGGFLVAVRALDPTAAVK